MNTSDFLQRLEMVEMQVARRGVRSTAVLDTMRAVPREVFVPAPLREFAHEDARLSLVEGRTVPRPWVVAAMAEALALQGQEMLLASSWHRAPPPR